MNPFAVSVSWNLYELDLGRVYKDGESELQCAAAHEVVGEMRECIEEGDHTGQFRVKLNHPRHLLELGASKIQKVYTGNTLAEPIIVNAIDWV